MMIAVAVVAMLSGMAAGLWRRHVSFKRQADEYAKKALNEMLRGYRVQIARFPSDGERRMRDEHFRLMDYSCAHRSDDADAPSGVISGPMSVRSALILPDLVRC
jgi:hypothetical protein